MIEINLLPDVKREYLKLQHNKRLVFMACFALAAVALLFLGITGGIVVTQGVLKQSARDKIQTNYTQLVSEKDSDGAPSINRLLTLQRDVVEVNQIYGELPVTSRLFDFFEQVNVPSPNNAILDRIVVTADGQITAALAGSIASFSALDTYKASLQSAEFVSKQHPDKKDAQKLFDSVQVNSSSLSSQRNVVSFRIQITFNPEAFELLTTDGGNQQVLLTGVRAYVPNQVTSDAQANTEVFSRTDPEKEDAKSEEEQE
jgi:hypothetical protein